MENTYKPTDKTQITDHFNVQEFRCKCGGSHDILIDTVLVDKLEQLRKVLNCSKIIITSGYRCAAHDKNVGGSGGGQHTKGTAADIECYDKSGIIIDPRKVCCAAQDLGFGGIGRIDGMATHVDVRTSNFWKGDETLGAAGTNASVTSDFYAYWNLSKSAVYGNSSAKSITLIIDGVTYDCTPSK